MWPLSKPLLKHKGWEKMLSVHLDPLYMLICEGFTCIADLCFHDNITLVLILNITGWGP